jgi:enoyl-CoA hydratase/carnithine racemase
MTKRFESLRIQTDGNVAMLTLSRPELMNRFDALAQAELLEALNILDSMDDVRVVLLAAEGETFSAGGDFEFMLACNHDLALRRRSLDGGMRLVHALLNLRPPVVAALHGDAIGLGATIVLCSDVVVSHDACRLVDPHVTVGLVAGDGGCLVWPQAAGMLRAKRYLLTGEPLTGEQAHRFGLVTDLVDSPADVRVRAMEIAERIASLPPLAVQGTKAALNAVLRHRFEEVGPLGLANEMTSYASDDLREAITAFRERRPGTYRGR